jgi:hypothetical protein
MNMTEPQMEKAAIAWLHEQDKLYLTRPKKFAPHEVTIAIGGYPPTLGSVADDVVRELQSRKVRIRYPRVGNKRWFELM